MDFNMMMMMKYNNCTILVMSTQHLSLFHIDTSHWRSSKSHAIFKNGDQIELIQSNRPRPITYHIRHHSFVLGLDE